MENKGHILIVSNLLDESVDNAIEQTEKFINCDAQLSIVHIIPRVPACYFQIPSMNKLERGLYAKAQARVKPLASALGIDEEHQWIVTGEVANDVKRLSRDISANAIFPEVDASAMFPWTHAKSFEKLCHLGDFISA